MRNAHRDLGLLWLERKRPDRAVDELRLALALDPEDAQCHAALAGCLVQLDQAEAALESAETAIGLEPDWSYPHRVRALALANRKQLRPAEAAAREAVQLDPEDAASFSVLAIVLGSQRRWRECVAAAEHGLELDPEDIDCANLRAQALVQLGQAEGADLALQAALRRDPDNPATHLTLGWSALQQGQARDAEQHYLTALRLEPTSDAALAGLVEAMKSRNFLYRTVLRAMLFLTRFPPGIALMIMIGTVVLRGAILKMAAASPALGIVLMPIFWGLVAFILMTWLASPLFNLVLRLDRRGRQALNEQQLTQSTWLGGMLLVVVALVGVWLLSPSPILGGTCGLAAFFTGVLIIPAMTTLSVGDRGKRWLLLGITLGMATLAGTALVRDHGLKVYGTTLLGYAERLSEEAMQGGEAMLEETADWPPEEQREFLSLLRQSAAMRERRQDTNTMIQWFLYIFVAFTWLSHAVTARDRTGST